MLCAAHRTKQRRVDKKLRFALYHGHSGTISNQERGFWSESNQHCDGTRGEIVWPQTGAAGYQLDHRTGDVWAAGPQRGGKNNPDENARHAASEKRRVCGVPIEDTKEIRRITGYLPQEFSMYPSMRVGEAMQYLGVLSGLNGKERAERTRRLLAKVNLTEQQHKKVRALSGGMKRRLGIAQALLGDPKVLIVDEPTAGLDPEERIRFRNLLCEVAQERIVLLSTHIVGDIEATCENVAILNEGRLLYNGTVSALTGEASGKVFTRAVDKRELPRLKKELCITSMHTQGGKTQIRCLSEVPVSGAQLCEPTIEDAYMLRLYRSGAQVDGLGGEQ